METDSDSRNLAARRAEQHLRRLKRYRTLVLVAIIGFICYGLLPGLGHVAGSAKKAADTIGSAATVPVSGPHSIELSAFRLGKTVSDYSAMRLLGESHRPGDVTDTDLASARAEIQARLSAVLLAVDPDTLEFTWNPGGFDSPASALLANALARKYGERIRASYLLGARLMSARWRATRLRDTVVWEASANVSPAASENTPAGILAALDAMTTEIIGSVGLDEFQPPIAIKDLVRSGNSAADALLMRLFSLDMALESRLAR